MSVEVKIVNVDAIQKFLPRFTVGTRRVAMDAAEDMVLEADRLAKKHARDPSRKPNKITGRYFNSIHPVISKGKTVLVGSIRSNVSYAKYIEEGTKPHIIRPRKMKALYWPGAGHPVKLVRHPGTKAYNVLGGARDAVLKRINEFVQKAFKRIFKVK